MSHDDQQPIDDILKQLKNGFRLEKRKENGKKYLREYFLDEHESFVSYYGSKKTWSQARTYYIKDLDEVRAGFRAQTFGRLVENGHVQSVDESRAFTIMYKNHRREVHLLAPDESTRDLWTKGLQHLIDRQAKTSQRHLIKEENWILNYFRLADKDRSNTLTKRECRRLLTDSLNVEVPNEYFEKIFQQADQSREGLLSPDEFVNFFHLLTQRDDLYEVMQKFTKNGSTQSMDQIRMTRDELLCFLQVTQRQVISTKENDDKIIYQHVHHGEHAQMLIDEFELDERSRRQGLITLDGFRNMMLSNDFDIVKPKLARQIYQDMSRPLCDYYINTSHNTYLFYSQLSGASNPEAYNRVLLAGCRAVELDCYDGNDGQPIVTHGFTLVKACSFESIIRYMEPNLFKTSPYPVILNIENHCSIEQQREMGRILKEILGDRLITKPLFDENADVLPSPEDLKHKVLIRSRKNFKRIKSFEDADGDESVFNRSIKFNRKSCIERSRTCQEDFGEFFTYLENVPYRSESYARENYSPFQSSSLAETRFEKLMREDSIDLLKQTAWRILRVYPGGLRQDSSNPYPIHAWNYGIQMAALNFQNQDDMMPLCYGKFLDNGACGYVLKPKYLIELNQTHYHPIQLQDHLDCPLIINLSIISGQFLPRSDKKSSDIPDPYVTVSVHGLPCDEQFYRTKVIENNGLNPRWNERCTFRVQYPQMSLLYFIVYDSDRFTRDDKLAQFCLPISMIQPGYRHIHLRAKNNDSTHSTLFVHIDLHDDSDEILRTLL